MLKMQLRNRPGDLCAFRPLGAQRKLQSRTFPTLSNTVLLMWVLKASWLCCAFDSGWLGTPEFSSRQSFRSTHNPQWLQVLGCIFFLVNFSPSRSPNPSPQAGLWEEGKQHEVCSKHRPSAPTARRWAASVPPLHSGKLRSELPALGEGPYLSAPLPMAAHLREPRSQSPRSSSLGLVPFSERIQLLARKLPVAAQVRHFLLCGCPLPPFGRDSAPPGRLRARAPCEGAPPLSHLSGQVRARAGERARVVRGDGKAELPVALVLPSRALSHTFTCTDLKVQFHQRLRLQEKGSEFIGSNMSQESDK